MSDVDLSEVDLSDVARSSSDSGASSSSSSTDRGIRPLDTDENYVGKLKRSPLSPPIRDSPRCKRLTTGTIALAAIGFILGLCCIAPFVVASTLKSKDDKKEMLNIIGYVFAGSCGICWLFALGLYIYSVSIKCK